MELSQFHISSCEIVELTKFIYLVFFFKFYHLILGYRFFFKKTYFTDLTLIFFLDIFFHYYFYPHPMSQVMS
jgi:hypothetical protein